MPITHIHTFLVHPAKGIANEQSIGGSAVPKSGKLFGLLRDIYDNAEQECNVDICFNSHSGSQRNPCRDLIIAYATRPQVTSGRTIAERLALYTDNRSRLGLLFLIAGKEGADHKVIVARFPADSGILAEQLGGSLNVEFLERIFMKSAKSYKAVLYRHRSLSTGFWNGSAIDKQMNDPDTNVSGYWIADFLDSDFRTTSAQGTKRLAVACRTAARNTEDPAVKSEIHAAITLASGQAGRQLSARDFIGRFGLSAKASQAVLAEMQPNLVNERFRFDATEFSRQVAIRTVELDNGGVLSAETDKFDRVFTQEFVDDDESIRYTTQGKIVKEKIGKSI